MPPEKVECPFCKDGTHVEVGISPQTGKVVSGRCWKCGSIFKVEDK
jgi:transposase-like protein